MVRLLTTSAANFNILSQSSKTLMQNVRKIKNKSNIMVQSQSKSMCNGVKGMTIGEYGLHAVSQKKVCNTLYSKYTSKALDKILKEGTKEVHIADFGAADCVNTGDIYKKLLEQVKDGRRVVFSIVDLPGNDWKTANNSCSMVGIPVVELGSQVPSGEESRIEFVAASFYGQCVPSSSLDVSFTSISTHWLSNVSDLRLPGSMYHGAHPLRTSLDDRDQIKKRGMEDGVNFLVSRAEELKTGGWLLMGNAITKEKNDGTTATQSTYHHLFETLNDVLVNWVKKSKISEDDVHRIFLPVYGKTADEWKECFEDPRVKLTGLRMEETEEVLMDNPYYNEVYSSDENGSNEMAANQFATEYAKSMLAWGKGTFLHIFKTEERLKEFVDDVIEAFALEPSKFKQDYLVQYVVAKKI